MRSGTHGHLPGAVDRFAALGLLVFAGFAHGQGDPNVTLAKQFPAPVAPGGTVVLEFSIENTSPTDAATDLAFTDDLDASLSGLHAVGLPQTDVCGAGSALSGSNVVSLTGGSVAAGDFCTFQVTLEVPESAIPGMYANITSEMTGQLGGQPLTSIPAVAILDVEGQVVFNKWFTTDPPPGHTVTLEFMIENTNTGHSVSNISFTDNLDAALAGLKAVGLPQNDVCGPGSQLSGSNVISLTGGSISPGGYCSIPVTVQVPTTARPGEYVNVTDELTGEQDGQPVSGGDASAPFTVVPHLELSKNFTDAPAHPGGTVELEFSLANNTSGTVSNIEFTDNLDAVLPGLAATGLPKNDVCGPGSQLSGSDTISLTGGSLASQGYTTFSVTLDVPPGAAPGMYENTTSVVVGDLGGASCTSAPAIEVLNVQDPITLSKSFVDDPVHAGDTVDLHFTLVNTIGSAVSNITFSDNLDAVLPGLAATGLPMAGVCGPGSQLSGSNTITLTGGQVPVGDFCSFSVTLQVPPDCGSGTHTNTTSRASGIADGQPVGGSPACAWATFIGRPTVWIYPWGTNVLFRWSAGAKDYWLQTSERLNPASWSDLPGTADVAGGECQYILRASPTSAYFRAYRSCP